ncbi:rhamnan synthesis F family protein [Lacrimispora sp.]|uniref:rhamnan synthesis F family protein n=1 Tax=Lacrimispora sp. TaxID=2719234 RepID=UPI002FD9080E
MKLDWTVVIYEQKEYPLGKDTIVLIDSLYKCCKSIYIFSSHKLAEDIGDLLRDFDNVKFIEVNNDVSLWKESARYLTGSKNIDTQEILYVDTSFFGPVYSLENMFTTMSEQSFDYWGLIYRYEYKDEYGKLVPRKLENAFIFISETIIKNHEFQKMLEDEKNESETLTEYLQSTQFLGGAYLNPIKFIAKRPEDNFDLLKYAPFYLLKYYECPVLSKSVFRDIKSEMLMFNLGNQTSDAVSYISEKTNYDAGLIWEYIIENCNMSVIRRNLNLDYILSGEHVDVDRNLYSQCAIAMHIYYEDLISECLEYISVIPTEMYLVISVANQEAYNTLFTALRQYRDNFDIIYSSNIGRDWGALLLDLWRYVKGYKYICYLHDKKTTGGVGYPMVGYSFMHYAWSSLIKNKAVINQIITLFIKNRFLGILTPDIPYHSGYVRLLGDSWTICYDKTWELAKEFGAERYMDEEQQPFALSSCFWFRKEALQNLMNKPVNKDAFPKEPMDTDGTFNHALERIIIYIAQRNGFYSATVLNEETARNNLINYQYLLSKSIEGSLKVFGMQSIMNLFGGQNVWSRFEVIKFIMDNQRVCIYGQGNNGKYVSDFLENQKLHYEYFLVSDGYTIKRSFLKHDAYYLSEKVSDKEEIGVIVAVDMKYRADVLEQLKRIGWKKIFVAN